MDVKWVCLGCGSDTDQCGLDSLGYCVHCGGGVPVPLDVYLKDQKGDQ